MLRFGVCRDGGDSGDADLGGVRAAGWVGDQLRLGAEHRGGGGVGDLPARQLGGGVARVPGGEQELVCGVPVGKPRLTLSP